MALGKEANAAVERNDLETAVACLAAAAQVNARLQKLCGNKAEQELWENFLEPATYMLMRDILGSDKPQ